MRFGDEVRRVRRPPPSASRRDAALAPQRGRRAVELWALSRQLDHGDATKIDDFWDASPDAAQER